MGGMILFFFLPSGVIVQYKKRNVAVMGGARRAEVGTEKEERGRR